MSEEVVQSEHVDAMNCLAEQALLMINEEESVITVRVYGDGCERIQKVLLCLAP